MGRILFTIEPGRDTWSEMRRSEKNRRWIARHRSALRLVVIALVLVIGAVSVTRCSTGSPSALPGTDEKVSNHSPLTKEQASSVREAGRALALDFARLLPASEKNFDDERSTERWLDCTARQKGFSFHPTLNGIQYTATIVLENRSMPTPMAQARVADTNTEWTSEDGQTGRSGVFVVDFKTKEPPVLIEATSPCYYVADVDGVPIDDVEALTGFVSRFWYETE